MAAGRDFGADDRTGTAPVAIVSAALARRYWPGEQAVGKRIKLSRPDGKAPWLTVVGIAGDVRYREWESARYDIYIPVEQRAQHRSDFVAGQDSPAPFDRDWKMKSGNLGSYVPARCSPFQDRTHIANRGTGGMLGIVSISQDLEIL